MKDKCIEFLRELGVSESEIAAEQGNIDFHVAKLANTDNVPEFLRAHVDEVTERALITKANITDGGVFFFTTDNHIHENTMYEVAIIREIAKKVGVDITLCGGDFPWAFGSRANCLTDGFFTFEYLNRVKDATKLYIARGNHDFTVRTSWEDESGSTLPYDKTSEIFARYQSGGLVKPEGKTYFYVDDTKNKIRYVVVDCCLDTIKGEDVSWGTIYGVTDEQIKWLADEAFRLPDKGEGWAVIAMGHIMCCEGIADTPEHFVNLDTIIKDFSNKRNGKYGDFSEEKAEFVAYIAGHQHEDKQLYCDNTLFVLTGSSSRLYDDAWNRDSGTVGEVLFDLYFVDKARKQLNIIRIGAGKDRVIKYK